jgi:hypothetical protein
MNRFTTYLIVGIVFAGLAAVGYIFNPHPAGAQGPADGLSVRIAKPLPLPITGNVGVSGTPSVNIAGTPSVKIADTLAVSLAPGATIRVVDEPGRAPYQSTLVFKQNQGCIGNACPLLFQSIPSGKRLVATNLMGTVYVDAPGFLFPPQLTGSGVTLLNGVPGRISVPAIVQPGVFPGPAGNENAFVINAQIRAFFDSGPAAPQMQISSTTPIATDSTGAFASNMTLSGYLVDCSTPSSCAAVV